jgi:hypothetical protein
MGGRTGQSAKTTLAVVQKADVSDSFILSPISWQFQPGIFFHPVLPVLCTYQVVLI